MNYALILAGGLGTRMQRKIPKQFIEIEDLPLIMHTLRKISLCLEIDEIVIVCLRDYIDYLKELCKNYQISKTVHVIAGGDSRSKSIVCGLNYIKKIGNDEDTIIIHNANMPMVSSQNIKECISNLKDDIGVVTTATKCTGYFYEIEKDGELRIGPDRNKIVHAKVPEAIHLKDALMLYSKYTNREYESFTTGMLALIDRRNVKVVYCETTNFKITTEDDYALMCSLMNRNRGEI